MPTPKFAILLSELQAPATVVGSDIDTIVGFHSTGELYPRDPSRPLSTLELKVNVQAFCRRYKRATDG